MSTIQNQTRCYGHLPSNICQENNPYIMVRIDSFSNIRQTVYLIQGSIFNAGEGVLCGNGGHKLVVL